MNREENELEKRLRESPVIGQNLIGSIDGIKSSYITRVSRYILNNIKKTIRYLGIYLN